MSTESPDLVQEQAQPVAPDTPQAPAVAGPLAAVILGAVASAALLWLSFFPINAGSLAWVALVPLLVLVRSRARRTWIFLYAWLCGLLFYFAAIRWLILADDREMFAIGGFPIRGGHLTWSSLAIYCACYIPLMIFLLRTLDRKTRWPLALSVPVVWTGLEYVRAHFGTGFPWYFLGHTQHAFLPVLQVADLGGAYLLTFLVAAVNGAVFEMLASVPSVRSRLGLHERTSFLSPRGQAVAVGALVAMSLVYGCIRLSQEHFATGPRVALIQGNFPQSLRNLASSNDAEREAAAQKSDAHFDELADGAIREQPDLIVWPETSARYPWYALPDGSPDEFSLGNAMLSLRRWPTHLLLGTNAYNQQVGAPSIPYNSAVMLAPETNPVAGRYDKIHRVPFGEYVPLRDTFAFMNKLAPYDFDYSVHSGESLTRFPLGQFRFGVLICFEDSDPLLARQYVRPAAPLLDRLTTFLSGGMYGKVLADDEAAPADFLLNISNDAWFDGSSEHDQHLAISRFRAVECRRSVARAVNMGISAVIDGSGRVVALPGPDWAGSKKMSAILTADIPLDDRTSLYARLGDWVPALSLLLLGVGLVMASRTRPE